MIAAPFTKVVSFIIPTVEGNMNRPQFAGGSKVSMDGAYGKK